MDALIESALARVDLDAHPFFRALEDGGLAKDDFVETQVQFHFAVTTFHRPLAAVAARVPDVGLRTRLARNVWEEHGEGDPGAAHGATFLVFLERLSGLTADDVEARALWPETRSFVAAVLGAATADEVLVGAACLGMIERLFIGISARIGRGVVARGWLAPDALVHYDLHERLDERHAEDLFDVVRALAKTPADRYAAEQGLGLGATVFDRLYRDLHANRARRWPRDVHGPHWRG